MESNKGLITKRIDRTFNYLDESFKNMYCIYDFRCVISELENATDSERPSILKRLYRMLDSCNIAFEKGKGCKYYSKLVENSNNIEEEIDDRLMYELYKIYKEYPSPNEYMKRMVDELSNDEDNWQEDSIRLRILKQFIKYGNYLKDADVEGKSIIIEYVRKNMEASGIKKTKGNINTDDVLEFIDDNIFNVVVKESKIDYTSIINKFKIENLKPNITKEDACKYIDEGLENDDELNSNRQLDNNDKVLKKIFFDGQREYDDLDVKEQKELKEKVKKIRNEIRKKQKERRKTLKSKYELIIMSDDLANGQFRAEGGTKKSLYLFAMVFDMTYRSNSVNIRTDIEKNLFTDYYTNNLLRFISEKYIKRSSDYELKPSGQGINYKNFAEIVYIYYIYKDMTPAEKIKKSVDMICKLKEKGMNKEVTPEVKKKRTKDYREIFCSEQEEFLNKIDLPEDDFENFVAENYDCDTFLSEYENKQGKKIVNSKGAIQVKTDQQTAYENYMTIIKLLEKENGGLDGCNYGIWFTDIAGLKEPMDSKTYSEDYNSYSKYGEINPEKFSEFVELLKGMNKFLGCTISEKDNTDNDEVVDTEADEDQEKKSKRSKKRKEWNEVSIRKTKSLQISSPEKITRTDLIVAYYYYYNCKYESTSKQSFIDVFKDFKSGIDPYLEQSFYEPISSRNLFDVITIYSSYSYVKV